jgi:putative endonuclease
MQFQQSYVYMITNTYETTLYIGVTSDLVKRVYQHRQGTYQGFTSKYKLDKLIYYEIFDNIENAIKREKQLKAGSREKKEMLIEHFNPSRNDLYGSILPGWGWFAGDCRALLRKARNDELRG